MADSALDRENSSVVMVFPFMDHDLTGLLENPNVKLSMPQIKYYLRCILQGLNHCHNKKILHRDVKVAYLWLLAFLSNAQALTGTQRPYIQHRRGQARRFRPGAICQH